MAFTYFTEAQLTALPDMSAIATGVKQDAHDRIAAIIENYCDTSWRAVTRVATFSSRGSSLPLSLRADAKTITSVMVDGVSIPDPQPVLGPDGYLYRGAIAWSQWPIGTSNIVVTYTSYKSLTVPADLTQAALTAARSWILSTRGTGVNDPRRRSINTSEGSVVFSVAGDDAPTGIPEVDAVLNGYRNRVDGYGFA